MTTYSGHLGAVEADSDVIGEMRSFDLTHEVREHDNSTMGKGYTSNNAGQETLSGTATVFHDHSDLGQQELVVGTTAVFIFYPTGDTAGHRQISATMRVLSAAYKTSNDGDVEATYTLKNTSAITVSAVS
jgi:hypothetical protein